MLKKLLIWNHLHYTLVIFQRQAVEKMNGMLAFVSNERERERERMCATHLCVCVYAQNIDGQLLKLGDGYTEVNHTIFCSCVCLKSSIIESKKYTKNNKNKKNISGGATRETDNTGYL